MKPIYKPRGAAAEYGEYAVNIYTGCPHGCYYCYAPSVLRKNPEEFRGRAVPRMGIIEAVKRQLDKEQLVKFQAKIMTLKMQSAMTGQDPAPAIIACIQEEIDAAPDGVWKDYLQVQYKLEDKMGGGEQTEEEDKAPKLGDPGVCPGCGAANQTGKFCEYCGAKMN